MLAYSYFLQPNTNRNALWMILLAHAFTGFFGSLLENIFLAKKVSNPTENWAILLGLNEINWIIFEASTGK